jgi:hypothetical protein
MAERSEQDPGDPAPAGGEYEMLNIFGSPTGIRVNLMHGHPFPAAPREYAQPDIIVLPEYLRPDLRSAIWWQESA